MILMPFDSRWDLLCMMSLQEKKSVVVSWYCCSVLLFGKDRLFLFSITHSIEISLFFIHWTLYLCTIYIFSSAIYKAPSKNREDKKKNRGKKRCPDGFWLEFCSVETDLLLLVVNKCKVLYPDFTCFDWSIMEASPQPWSFLWSDQIHFLSFLFLFSMYLCVSSLTLILFQWLKPSIISIEKCILKDCLQQ